MNLREISDVNILNKFAEDFCAVVDRFARYVVVSGFVAIAHGRSRGTEDIDVMIEEVSRGDFVKLHGVLVEAGFECLYPEDARDVYDVLKSGVGARYSWKGVELPNMEVRFARDDLDREQLGSRRKIEFTGIDVFFPRVEESIAFKEELLGSEKDLEDARHLRLVCEGLNEDYIDDYKKKIRRFKFGSR